MRNPSSDCQFPLHEVQIPSVAIISETILYNRNLGLEVNRSCAQPLFSTKTL
jgi:hypothetical protein